MDNDSVLGVLGLSLRAGKLASGDEQVRVLCENKKARCVFVAGDAGPSTSKRASHYADSANIPCVTLPHTRETLGAALGKTGCAVCAVSDIGLAATAVRGLASQNAAYASAAERLNVKNVRIQSRRGKKKHREPVGMRDGNPSPRRKKPASRTGQGWYKSG